VYNASQVHKQQKETAVDKEQKTAVDKEQKTAQQVTAQQVLQDSKGKTQKESKKTK